MKKNNRAIKEKPIVIWSIFLVGLILIVKSYIEGSFMDSFVIVGAGFMFVSLELYLNVEQ